MPILDVEIVTRPGESMAPHLARELANRVGAIFGSPPGHTWVKVRPLAGEHYAENDDGPQDVYPVFVSVLKAKRPSNDELQKEVKQLTTTIARVCNRPEENVHIVYLPEGSGRISFGGKVIGS